MNHIRSMRVFLAIHDEGSIAGAARKLGLSAPSVSRLLADLEDWLGHPLFRRTTRHLSLTELGRRFLPRCIEIVTNTDAMRREAQDYGDVPSGHLRVTAPSIIARRYLSPVLVDFLSRYPEVTIDLDTTDRPIDLLAEEMDVAIRMGALEDSSLSMRYLFSVRSMLVASPSFLEKHGRPTTVEELVQLPCLVDTVPRYGARWPILGGRDVEGPASVSNGEIVRDLAVSGLGIAYLPDVFVADDIARGDLQEIMPELASADVSVNAVYPPRRFITPAARAFVDAVLRATSSDR